MVTRREIEEGCKGKNRSVKGSLNIYLDFDKVTLACKIKFMIYPEM